MVDPGMPELAHAIDVTVKNDATVVRLLHEYLRVAVPG